MEDTSRRMMEEPLSPMARVFQSPGTDCCTIYIVGFKTKIDPDIIIDDLKQNVYKHPRFSSKLADDGARWIKTDVNVEDHVFVPEIDDSGETLDEGEEFVDDYVSNLSRFPMDRSRPPWDIHVLNVKTCNSETVVVIRSHHSLGDGMSLMSLLMACTRKTSDPEAFPTAPTLKQRKAIKNKSWFLRLMLTVYSTMRLIWNTVEDLLLLLATVLFLKDTETSLKGAASAQSNPKKFCHRIVSLDDIRLIKDALDMTINDVLLGVTQAAISRYLSNSHDKTNEDGVRRTPVLNNNVSNIRLRAGVSVNLRSDIGIQPLADMMAKGSKCRWGNHFSIILVPLSIGLETDPLVYLFKAKSAMDRMKNSLYAPLLYSIIEFILNVFGAKVGALLFKQTVSNTTTFISNVIGPTEEISFHGHPIAYIIPSGYGSSQALLIYYQSYADKIVISIAVDPTIIPAPHQLCDEMEESLKAMKVSVLRKGY